MTHSPSHPQSPVSLEQFMAIVMEQLRGVSSRLDGLDRDLKNTTQYTVEIALLKQRQSDLEIRLKDLEAESVTKSDFEPIKRLAYLVITAALAAVGGLIWTLVTRH